MKAVLLTEQSSLNSHLNPWSYLTVSPFSLNRNYISFVCFANKEVLPMVRSFQSYFVKMNSIFIRKLKL